MSCPLDIYILSLHDPLPILLPIADELLAQLCDFLRRRDLSTSHLSFSLFHERHDCTEVNIGLRQASRSQAHLMLLLETHFEKLSIPSPVVSIKIEVMKFDAFFARSNSLLKEETAETKRSDDNSLAQFIDRLQARLGDNHVKSVLHVSQHCPEHANAQLDYKQKTSQGQRQEKSIAVSQNPRPLWLLEKPKQLNINKGRLFYRKPIVIISGPERIETHWWSGADVRRD